MQAQGADRSSLLEPAPRPGPVLELESSLQHVEERTVSYQELGLSRGSILRRLTVH